MFKVTVELTPFEEELVEVAELVRQAKWRAATSSDNRVAQQYVNPSDIVTTVDFNAVVPRTAYDATATTLYWLMYQLMMETNLPNIVVTVDELMGYLADGITVREALDVYAQNHWSD